MSDTFTGTPDQNVTDAPDEVTCADCGEVYPEGTTVCEGTDEAPHTPVQLSSEVTEEGLDDNSGQGEAQTLAEAPDAEADAAEANVDDDQYRSIADAARKGGAVTRKVEFRSVDGGDGLTLEGYAAVFDSPAQIEDFAGKYTETIQRGAFKKTLAERKPQLLFDHGRHPMIGNMPIGTITELREDPKGLYVKARMSDNWLIEPVRDAIASRAVDGMSVRMTVVRDRWSAGAAGVERSVGEVGLLELGPVVFPAYDQTEVALRSRGIDPANADPAEVARSVASTAGDTPAAAEVPAPVTSDHPGDLQLSVLRARAIVALDADTERSNNVAR